MSPRVRYTGIVPVPLFLDRRIQVFLVVMVVLLAGVQGDKNHRKHGRHKNSNMHVTGQPREVVEFRSGPSVRRDSSPEIILKAKDQDLREKGKICIGTNGRMSVPSNRDHHYRNLRDRFTNCTYVDGNLELTWLQDENLDLSFLQYIREVTGYVLISHVDIRRIVLPSLQIIRGRTLFKMNVREEEFALLVTLSKMDTLELPALRDVLRGSIGLFNNYNLCHIRTINWKEIITDPQGKFVYVYNFTSPERECTPCHKDCVAGCWGEGKENCQKFSKENCSPQCYQGRCFGPNPRECCHLFCAGGCVGPKQSDCIACRNFYDEGVCKQECPPMQIYNPITYSWEVNPKGKYAYGATCVKNCPEHLLKDNGACVRTCPPQKKAVNGECVPCEGPCPKTCRGDTLVHSGNIDSFRECTVIEGYLQILENSFRGFQNIFPNYTFGERYLPMHPDRLEVFSTLKQITGNLNIQAYHPDFRNLSYFRNLEVIEGRALSEYFSSLYIVKTSLRSLELRSLNKISSGTVTILENEHLCFAEQINWDKIRKNYEHNLMLSNNSNVTECTRQGLVCHEQCSSDGCWGIGADKCLSCTHFKLDNECLQNCSVFSGIYRSGTSECKRCHEECGSSCHGPGPDNCTTCKHFKDGPYCVSKCPGNKYHQGGVCMACPETCVGGCTGPRNTIGAGGCNSCDLAIMNENATFQRCLHKTETCPDGYYLEWVAPQEQQEFLVPLAGKAICRKCHPRCKKCTAYGFHEQVCQQCTSYKKGEQCEDECPMDHYPDNSTQECNPCDIECRGCRGSGPENCHVCQNFKIYNYEGSGNSSFTCVATCPLELPYRTFPDNSEAYCSDKEYAPMHLTSLGVNKIYMYIGIAFIGLAFAVTAIILATWRKRVKNKEEALKMTMAMTGLEDELLTHPKVLPNVAKLRIIKETEIRKGPMLGYGAFGAVYRGVWVPEGESNKIPVAIKVLHEDTGCNSNRSKEFLSEAVIMASVEHPNLLQLLAVCMTSQMMLITQLMPLGCLLDFVRKNRDKVGSKALLNWCTQIARGMAYLEEKRLVHRDLAARNVLVQTPACIKITDFGLAKLLDINEEEYKADGGKMPIKWLALECIQHRIFTHKSDVWAFGVTVWELLTFGGRPYDNVPAREVPELLEKGERLPQPPIASIDVYVIMIKCWMLDAESRPCFKELADDFCKMSKDPGRYLVIPGNIYPKLPNREDQDPSRSGATAMETSESQSECEEYLQPKSRSPLHIGAFPNDPFNNWNQGMNSDGSSQYQNNFNQKLLKYNQNHGLDTTSLQTTQTDVSSIKYCGDSIKIRDDMGSDEYDSGRSQAQIGTLKLELPVDEDDYLMPSPQQTQGASAYVDLIDSKNSADGASSTNTRYNDFYKTNIDNPEYLMGNDSPSQTVGLPNIERPRTPGSPEASGFTPAQPHRISEEESDHEYYNDFDRLKRELQPLQKNKEGSLV